MPKYVFTYRSPLDAIESDPDSVAPWIAWFGEIKDSVVDLGQPVSESRRVGNAAAETLTGYSVTTVGHAETGRLWQARAFWEKADLTLEVSRELAKYDGKLTGATFLPDQRSVAIYGSRPEIAIVDVRSVSEPPSRRLRAPARIRRAACSGRWSRVSINTTTCPPRAAMRLAVSTTCSTVWA